MNNNPMKIAIAEATAGTQTKQGGPFGAVVVKDGVIIGRGHNRVIANADPTAHGEIEAIRDACKNTNSHNLSGSVLYTTYYPCPMCLGAILWARIEKVYYCFTSEDAAAIGFDDKEFYDRLGSSDFMSEFLQLDDAEKEACQEMVDAYINSNPTEY